MYGAEQRKAELELVANLYRSLGDGTAFDLLIKAVQENVDLADRMSRPLAENAVLNDQFDRVADLIAAGETTVSDDPMQRVVEEVGAAAIVIDERGRQVVANKAGRALFGLANGHHFATASLDPHYRKSFEDLLRSPEALAEGDAVIMRLDAELGAGPDGDCLEIIRLTWSKHDRSFFALRMLDFPWSDDVSDTLRSSFSLTEAECDVTRRLFDRQNIVSVAEGRGTSVETVKKQIQSILAKTGSKNRMDLVRLTGSISARRAVRHLSALSEWEDPLGRQQPFICEDGRQLAYTWMGAEHGRCVLMLHGQSIAYLLPRRAEKIIEAAGLKLIIPSRPGFGESDFDPARPAVAENIESLAQFCDATGLVDIPVVGIHSGTAIGLALARHRPDLVRQIIGIGYLWHRDLPTPAVPPTHQKVILDLAMKTPKLLRLLVGLAYRNLKKHGPDWYLARLLDAVEVDRNTYRSGRDLPLIRQAALHLLRHGPAAYTRELQTISHDWPADLRAFGGDVHFLVSEFDVIFDQRTFADALGANNRLTVDAAPASGELLLYQQAELIARTIVDRLRAAS